MKKKISLNENEVVRRSGVDLNPSTARPAGLEGSYPEVDNGGQFDGGEDAEEGVLALDAPTNLRVKSQEVNTRPGGFTTVNVIIEFDGVQGATEYEYRITEISSPEIEIT